jgi:mannose-6-phosphate isomerase-like protein (cupin superfamily)
MNKHILTSGGGFVGKVNHVRKSVDKGKKDGHSSYAPIGKLSNVVNVREKLRQIREYWKPHIVAELNGQQVKLDKLKGEFIWHHHKNEDEMFLVLKGKFRLEFRDRQVWLEEGEFIVVPRGVEHRPVAEEEVHILLFEPSSTLNTGNIRNQRTVEKPEMI